MLPFRLLFILILSYTLHATVFLKSNYTITNNVVMLSDIIENPTKETKLYTINKIRHSKRVKAKELIQKLQTLGYSDIRTAHAYIQFSQKSPIKTEKIKTAIFNYYKQNYKHITIQKIVIKPIRYISYLPKNYIVGFPRNAYLSHKEILFVKTPDNKKIFFNYTIYAKLNVYETKKKIAKGEELSLLNCKKKSIILDKFKAMPLIELPNAHYEAKHRLKKFLLLTKRDVIGLFLVKRGSYITVSIQDGGVYISFSARALQSGRYGDTIFVMHQNKKKIRVRVIGRNRAEVE